MPAPTQAELDDVFLRLRGLLERYSPPFAARTDGVRDKPNYHLWSEKAVVVAGRPREEVMFAAVIEQKGYVGLYYMPVYAEPERQRLFPPGLLRLLKGKSCFHVKQLDGELDGQIEQALADGFELYRERGWV